MGFIYSIYYARQAIELRDFFNQCYQELLVETCGESSKGFIHLVEESTTRTPGKTLAIMTMVFEALCIASFMVLCCGRNFKGAKVMAGIILFIGVLLAAGVFAAQWANNIFDTLITNAPSFFPLDGDPHLITNNNTVLIQTTADINGFNFYCSIVLSVLYAISTLFVAGSMAQKAIEFLTRPQETSSNSTWCCNWGRKTAPTGNATPRLAGDDNESLLSVSEDESEEAAYHPDDLPGARYYQFA